MMEGNGQQNGLVNAAALLVACVVAAALAGYADSAAALAGAVYLGFGFVVAAVSSFQMRLERRESLERLEYDEMMRERKDAALFEDTGEDTFIAKRSREQFERYLVPAFTAGLLLAQWGAVWLLWERLPELGPPNLNNAAVAMAGFGAFSMILFLLGKYSVGVARMEGRRLLRPGGAYLLLGSMICLLVVLTEAGAWFGFERLDGLVARALVVLLGLAGAESLVNLALEAYRPRGKGREDRLLYESRLVGLLGEPAGLVRTVAQALDYQFGFRVSETWFYKFLERSLGWLVLLQAGILLLSTTFVILEPQEVGIRERLGRRDAGGKILEAGLHFKLPWPIDRVYRHPAKEVQTFHIGYTVDEERAKERTLLWTVSHYKEEVNFLVASGEQEEGLTDEGTVPVNFLTAAIPVQYVVRDVESWFYKHRDAKGLLERIGYREVVRYLVNVDVLEIMSSGRRKAATELRERIQKAADKAALGVKVLFVGLQDIHPPVGEQRVPVAAAFEEVIGAVQEKEAAIMEAEAYEAEILPKARAEAARLRSAAEAYRKARMEGAKAAAAQFEQQGKAMAAAPNVFRSRKYFDVLANSLTNVRKYIITPDSVDEVFTINLEDRIAQDLLLDARPEEN